MTKFRSAVRTDVGFPGECVAFHHRNGPARPVKCPSCDRNVLVDANGSRRRYCSLQCMISRDQRGDRNANWKGGRALNYGPGWKATKRLIRDRDEVCQHCGKTPAENGRALDVHHVEPFRFSGDHSLDNLVALCRSCHMRADDHGRRGQARFLRKQGIVKPPNKRDIRHREAKRRKIERMRSRAMLQGRAFDLDAQGRSLRQIARDIGVSHQTVANWLSGAVRRLVS